MRDVGLTRGQRTDQRDALLRLSHERQHAVVAQQHDRLTGCFAGHFSGWPGNGSVVGYTTGALDQRQQVVRGAIERRLAYTTVSHASAKMQWWAGHLQVEPGIHRGGTV